MTSNLRDPQVLFVYHANPKFYAAPPLSSRQVSAGPLATELRNGDEFKIMRTKYGRFNLADEVKRLPAKQKPDIIFIRIDASGSVLPTHLQDCGCPCVLLIGDTHHMGRPLQTVCDYLQSAKYSHAVTYNNRHHAHFLVRAGARNVLWVPGITVTPRFTGLSESRDPIVSFVGNVVGTHVRRARFLRSLQSSGLPFRSGTAHGDEMARIFASSAASFNCSLNGDLNMRVFEVMAAGGTLLTDLPSPASGFRELFSEGEHYLGYRSEEELLEKAAFLIKNPAASLEMGRRALEHYHRNLHLELMTKRLFSIVMEGERDELMEIRDPRIFASANTVSGVTPSARIDLYESLQQAHLERGSITVAVDPSTPADVVMDIADFTHLELLLIEPEFDSRLALWNEVGALRGGYAGVHVLPHSETLPEADFLIISSEALSALTFNQLSSFSGEIVRWDDKQVKEDWRLRSVGSNGRLYLPAFGILNVIDSRRPFSQWPDLTKVVPNSNCAFAPSDHQAHFTFSRAALAGRSGGLQDEYRDIILRLEKVAVDTLEVESISFKFQIYRRLPSIEFREMDTIQANHPWPHTRNSDSWGQFFRLFVQPDRSPVEEVKQDLDTFPEQYQHLFLQIALHLPKILSTVLPATQPRMEPSEESFWIETAEQSAESFVEVYLANTQSATKCES